MFTCTLADAEYDCGMIGKQHLAPCETWRTEYSNCARTGTPIDHAPKEAHYSHWVAERAIDFIDHDRGDAEPLFLMANFFDPHHSVGVPQEFRDLIDADAIPIPVKIENELAENPSAHRAFSEKSYSGTAPGFQDYAAEEIKEIRAQYWAMIDLIDHVAR